MKLEITFESLRNAISSLGIEEKRRFWQILDEEINQGEADLLAEDTYDWGLEGQPQGKPVVGIFKTILIKFNCRVRYAFS